MARITKDPEVRRNELMDIAEQLFVEKGYDKVSASDIIRKAGVAQGTFYYYFQSKDEIVRTIIDRYLDRYEEFVSRVAGDASMDAPQQLRLISEALYELSLQKTKLGKQACDAAKISNHTGYRRHLRAKIIPVIQRIVSKGVEEGFFKTEYPGETAELLVVLSQHVHDELKETGDQDACRPKFEAAMAMMEKALSARKGSFRPRS